MGDENAKALSAKKGSPFLNTAQTAFYVGLSTRTLEAMRSHGGGPPYRRHGRYIRYHIEDIDLWSRGDIATLGTIVGARSTHGLGK